MTNGKRDYKKELEWEKTRATHRLKDRVMRHAARRAEERKVGDLPPSTHIDHIKALTDGGSNAKSNQRLVSAHTNLEKEAHRKQAVARRKK